MQKEHTQNFLLKKNLIFLDAEFITTKFKQNRQRRYMQEIVEIGAVIKNSCSGDLDNYSSIVKPKLYLKCLNSNNLFTKFSFQELSSGKDLHEVLLDISKYYNKHESIVLTWGCTDFYSISMLCKKYGIQNIFNKDDYIDLSYEFKKLYKLKQEVSLDKAIKQLNLNKIENRHRAHSDANALLYIYEQMVIDGFVDLCIYSNNNEVI